jgi:hypothetical protein
MVRTAIRVKIVGPCAAGKSVLVARLRKLDYDAHTAAQDHSYVPDMWKRRNPPDVLVYLDVNLEAMHARGRVGMGWDQRYLDEQHHRLRHAREHCDLYLLTAGLSEAEVLSVVLEYLGQVGASPSFSRNRAGAQ